MIIVNIDSFLTPTNPQMLWLIDKDNPEVPLKRYSKIDVDIWQSGLYKKLNNKIQYNGVEYYLPNSEYNEIKVLCKNKNLDPLNLGISKHEFINPKYVKSLDFKLNKTILSELKNSKEEISIIIASYVPQIYSEIVNKIIENTLKEEMGLNISNLYWISNSFYESQNKKTSYKKSLVILSNLIGYEIKNNSFTDNKIPNHTYITYYDNDLDMPYYLNQLDKNYRYLRNTSKELKDKPLDGKVVYKQVLTTKGFTDYVFDYTDVKIFTQF